MLVKISILFLLIFSISSCKNETEKINSQFSSYTLSIDSCKRLELPQELLEISGLVYYNGTIYGHNDEQAIIFAINTDDGSISSKFQLGDQVISKDFEGIAAANDNFYLITSSGEIYIWNIRDSLNNYRIVQTGLDKQNNIEGLCYDQKNAALLIACKDYPGNSYDGFRAIYSFDLQTEKLNAAPRFLISIEDIKTKLDINDFSPSGIEIRPDGNIFIISSRDKAIVEINDKGNIIDYSNLPEFHDQPEGITFDGGFDLIISDEGKYGTPMLTIYFTNK